MISRRKEDRSVTVVRYIGSFDDFLPIEFKGRPIFERGHGSDREEYSLKEYLEENPVPGIIVREPGVLDEEDFEALEGNYRQSRKIMEEGEVTGIAYGIPEYDDRAMDEREYFGESLTLEEAKQKLGGDQNARE